MDDVGTPKILSYFSVVSPTLVLTLDIFIIVLFITKTQTPKALNKKWGHLNPLRHGDCRLRVWFLCLLLTLQQQPLGLWFVK